MEKKPTYDERKAKALATGKEYLYVTCPLCLKSRPMKIFSNRKIFKIDPNCAMLQTRMMLGGKGSGGFFRDEGKDVNISDLKAKHPSIYKNLKTEIGKLHDLFSKER